MLLHNAAANKEAKAHAGEAAVVHVRRTVEAVEDARQIFRRDPDAVVAHVERRLGVSLADTDPDLAPEERVRQALKRAA